MELSKIELQLIEKYEDRLRQSRSNYMRAICSIDIEKLNEIYQKLTGFKYKLNAGCSECQLNFMKSFDKVFSKYKEQKQLELNTDIQEVKEEEVTKIKRKKTKKDEPN